MRKNTPCIWEGFQNCALNITWRTLFMEINSCRWFVSLFPSSLYHLFTMDTIGGFSFYIHSWRYFFLFSSPLKRICILLRIGVVDRWGCPQTIPAPLTSHSLTTLRSPRDQNSLSPIQTEFARAISNVNSHKPFNVDWKGFNDRQVWCLWKAYVTHNKFNCSAAEIMIRETRLLQKFLLRYKSNSKRS